MICANLFVTNVVWNFVLNENLNESVRGIDWASDGQTYTTPVVEKRAYEDYMRYCPIPYSETLKFSNLVQNKGWK